MVKEAAIEEAGRLRDMAAQLTEMAETIEKKSPSAFRFTRSRPTDSAYMATPLLVQQAEDEYRLRRTRIPGIQDAILGEPSWDILLDLFVQQAKGRQVSTTSACIASNAPMTTALRHLNILETHGLIQSSKINHDDRIRVVELSATARKLMTDYLVRRAKLSGINLSQLSPHVVPI